MPVCLNISALADDIIEEDEKFFVNIEPLNDENVNVVSATVTIYETCKYIPLSK